MSEKSNIQWTDSTGGPWLVCSEVSPGCANCYARELIETRLAPLIRKSYKAAGYADWETRALWGDSAPRVLSKGFWSDIKRFNNQPWICDECGMQHALPGGVCTTKGCTCETKHRRRSFPSLIDWLDEMPAGIIDQDGYPLEWLHVFTRFLAVLKSADKITHILCTKRPENFFPLMKQAAEFAATYDPCLAGWIDDWMTGQVVPKHIVLLTTAENQAMADRRVPALLKIPAICHGLSMEPLLGPVEIKSADLVKLKWIILGGESGADARECRLEWLWQTVLQAEEMMLQVEEADVAVLVKQLGAFAVCENVNSFSFSDDVKLELYGESLPAGARVLTRDKKGGDIKEFPTQLQHRSWPKGF